MKARNDEYTTYMTAFIHVKMKGMAREEKRAQIRQAVIDGLLTLDEARIIRAKELGPTN